MAENNVLPDPGWHITDTNADGKSEFAKNFPTTLAPTHLQGGARIRLAYTMSGVPDTLTDQADLKQYQQDLEQMKNIPPIVPPQGVGGVWIIDHPPGSRVPMHRTVTLDVIAQLAGEIELELESGEVRTLKPGDVALQRATVHAWHNPSETRWARLMAVVVACEPVRAGGQTLGAYFPKPPGAA